VTAAARRVVVALAAVALAWAAVPGAVPLFDGINFPDEPYRYVAPPPGYQHTPKALPASGSSEVSAGTNVFTVYVNTDEIAPQVNVVVPNRMFKLSAGARTLTITAVPRAPDRQPSKGTIDGNIYRVSAATVPAGPAAFDPPPGDAASLATVTMRATTAKKPAPSFLFRSQPTLPWRVLASFASGNDIYTTHFAGFGDYALAFGVVAGTKQGSSGTAILVSVLLILVLSAAGGVIAVRVRRRPAHQAGESPP
jgi:hypothetical protein